MSARAIKASMIDDADLLLRIAAHAGKDYDRESLFGGSFTWPQKGGRWAGTRDLQEWYPTIPRKVLVAKAGQLIKRKLLDGCACGCRGDFEITALGAAWLAQGVGSSPTVDSRSSIQTRH